MMAEVWIDGERVPAERAVVSVFDRGFLYGDSVFETLRTYDGRPFALSEHLNRLAESARRVWIDLPVSVSVLGSEVERAVEQSQSEECYLRLMVTRGVGALGLNPKHASSPRRVMIVDQLTPPPPLDYQQGIAAITFEAQRLSDATEAAGAKLGNYLVAVLAHRKAAEQNAKEALIRDPDGKVIEGATSNFFWVEGGALYTPPVEAGILAGITRAHVLDLAHDQGLRVEFAIPDVARLLAAQEIFLSSSIRELLSVCTLDGQPIGSGRPGPVARELLLSFRQHCRLSVAEQPSEKKAGPGSRL